MAKITGLKELEKSFKKVQKEINKQTKTAIRKSLNAGAKELKKSVKLAVPIMANSTNFRQKGTIKNNVRHKTKVAKNGLSGVAIIRISRPKGQRMARIGENTKDRRDPFYWWMVEYGTEKMDGQHFMEKAGVQGKDRALKVVEKTFNQEMKKIKLP